MKNQKRLLAILIALIFPFLALFSFVSKAASVSEPAGILEQNGNGGWFYGVIVDGSAGYVTGVRSGNFNGDALTDLVVSGCVTTCTLTFMVQNEDGELVNSGTPLDPRSSGEFLVADLTDDGLDDIAIYVRGTLTNSIKVFEQTGPLTFELQSYPILYRPDAITAGDFNDDGRTDLAVSYFLAPYMSVMLQDSLGNLLPPVNYPTFSRGFNDMDTGDFNNDGLTDIVQTHGGAGFVEESISVFLQNNAGTLNPAIHYDIDPNENVVAESVTAGDINNDGRDDILVQSNSGLSVFEQTDSGIPTIPIIYPSYANPSDIEIADINLDGLNDVLTLGDGFTHLALFLQKENDNTLAPFELYPITYGGSFQQNALNVADLNNDGRPDAAIASRSNGFALLYHRLPPDFVLGLEPSTVTVNGYEDPITFTLSISGIHNFSNTVALSFTEMPSGTVHNLPSGPFTTPMTVEFTVALSSTLVPSPEPYLFEITATSSKLTHAVTAEIYLIKQTYLPFILKP